MGLFKIWKDHVTQYSNRYREVQNADGTICLLYTSDAADEL